MFNKTKTGVPFTRFAGLAGIVFAAIIFLANFLILVPAGEPPPGSDIDAVIDFYSTQTGAIALASAFLPLAWFAATLFSAGVAAASRRSEHQRVEAWSLVGLAGILLQNGTIAVFSAVRLTLAETEGAVAPEALATLHDALLLLNGTFLALALTGLSIAGLLSGIIGRWTATIGFSAAALQFASASLASLVLQHGGILGFMGLAGWLLWVGWLILYGIALIRTPVSSATTTS